MLNPAARNQIINVGADVPYTVNELSALVAEVMGVRTHVNHLPPRNEVKVAFSDHSKAERIFGKRAKTPLSAGLRSMAEWVNRHGARESSVFENIEVRKNMPPSWAAVSLAGSRELAGVVRDSEFLMKREAFNNCVAEFRNRQAARQGQVPTVFRRWTSVSCRGQRRAVTSN